MNQNNELEFTISKSLESSKGYLTYLFRELDGFKAKDSYGSSTQGLRRIGSEAIIQTELYHSLRVKQPEFIVSPEFRPFSGMGSKSKNKRIDLAIFENISSISLQPPEAITWLEIKITGGRENVTGDYTKDFKKLLELAEGYYNNGKKIPRIIGTIVFVESSQKTITNENPENFILGSTIKECQQAPEWFKKNFYEALLWREGGNWALRRVFP